MRIVFLFFWLIPYIGVGQSEIPKKAEAVIVRCDNPDVSLKKLARAMIQKGYRITEKDFEIGYVTGEWTQDEKFFSNPLQVVATAMVEDNTIVITGKFSIDRTATGDFIDFSTSKWFGGKKGGYKVTFGKLIDLGFAIDNQLAYR